MKISIAKVSLMILFCIEAAIPEDIEIARFIPDNGKDSWKQSTDLFNIPRSVCEDADYCSSACNTGQTVNDHHYNCSCPKDYATLTYHDMLWECRQNEEARKQLGCAKNNNFKGEKEQDRLRTLKPEVWWETDLKHENCALNISSSWYNGCHGEQFSISGSTSVFTLRWQRSKSKCKIKVLDVETIELFRGRVINLGIRWTTNLKDACLLFKLEGTINCPVDKPPVRVIVPTASSTDNPRRVTISPTSTRSAILAEKASKQTTESLQPSSGIKLTHDDDNSSPPIGLIIGVTVSIVTLLLLIAAFFFYRRHKSREDTYRNTSDPIKENTSEGRMQAKGVFHPEAQNGDVTNSNTDQRSSKSAGIYTSLSVPEGHNMYGHINEHGQLNNTIQEYSLDNKEDGYRYGSITADLPVYHALEDQPSEYPDKAENNGLTNADPVYNVLEETFPGNSERSECYGTVPVNEPFYNTLEESNSTDGPPSRNSEPVYNTLEESHPDADYHNDSRGLQDPVYYNILEGPVTDDTGSNISDGTNIPVYAVVNKKKK